MYHVNTKTGEVGICKAKSPETCPFGCKNHSESLDEIQIKADKIIFQNKYNSINQKLKKYNLQISKKKYIEYHKSYKDFESIEKLARKSFKMTGSNWGKYYFEYHDSLSENFYCKYLPEEDFIYYAIDFKYFKEAIEDDNNYNYYEDLGFDPDDDEFSRCKYIIIEVNKKIVEEKYDYQDSFYQE